MTSKTNHEKDAKLKVRASHFSNAADAHHSDVADFSKSSSSNSSGSSEGSSVSGSVSSGE